MSARRVAPDAQRCEARLGFYALKVQVRRGHPPDRRCARRAHVSVAGRRLCRFHAGGVRPNPRPRRIPAVQKVAMRAWWDAARRRAGADLARPEPTYADLARAFGVCDATAWRTINETNGGPKP